MARGFESKDVEFQQAEAERLDRTRLAPVPENRERVDRRRSLQMSLTRVRQDLEQASAAHHRRMLEQAIESLEAQLAALESA
jgi:hypothetical protein